MSDLKRLYIGRHAKSSWDSAMIADFDRPLTDRGLADSYEMAQRMKLRGEMVDLIITSPATRALHTAVIYARVLKVPFEYFQLNSDLYMHGEEPILEQLRMLDSSVNAIMIFGHNPDSTRLANLFLNDPINNLPTCGVVKLTFRVSDWEDIHRGKIVDSFFDFPKNK